MNIAKTLAPAAAALLFASASHAQVVDRPLLIVTTPGGKPVIAVTAAGRVSFDWLRVEACARDDRPGYESARASCLMAMAAREEGRK